MKLYILRHGQAEARAANDSLRALTETGRSDVERMVSAMRADILGPEQLWSSPYRRAQQTAEIADRILSATEPASAPIDTVTTDCLVPEAALSELYARLQSSQAQSVLLVSHQPLVGSLLDDLCGTDPGFHPMGTASLACVELELPARGMGRLAWLRHKESVG